MLDRRRDAVMMREMKGRMPNLNVLTPLTGDALVERIVQSVQRAFDQSTKSAGLGAILRLDESMAILDSAAMDLRTLANRGDPALAGVALGAIKELETFVGPAVRNSIADQIEAEWYSHPLREARRP